MCRWSSGPMRAVFTSPLPVSRETRGAVVRVEVDVSRSGLDRACGRGDVGRLDGATAGIDLELPAGAWVIATSPEPVSSEITPLASSSVTSPEPVSISS